MLNGRRRGGGEGEDGFLGQVNTTFSNGMVYFSHSCTACESGAGSTVVADGFENDGRDLIFFNKEPFKKVKHNGARPGIQAHSLAS